MDSNLKPVKSVRTNIKKFESLSFADATKGSSPESAGSGKENDLRKAQPPPSNQSLRSSGSSKTLIQVVNDSATTLSSKPASPEEVPSPDSTLLSVSTEDVSPSDKLHSCSVPEGGSEAYERSPPLSSISANQNLINTTASAPTSDVVSEDRIDPGPLPSVKAILSPKEATSILKSNPSLEQLTSVLSYVKDGLEDKHDFNVKVHSAASSALLHALVGTTVKNYWDTLESMKNERRMLLECLSSITGLATVRACLVSLIQDFKQGDTRPKAVTTSRMAMAQKVIMLLAWILRPQKPHSFLSSIMKDVFHLYVRSGQREAIVQELVSLIAGSRLHSTVSEATVIFSMSDPKDDTGLWMGDARQWSTWLGRNITYAASQTEVHEEEKWRALGSLVKRGFSLGQPEMIVSEIYRGLLIGSKALWPQMQALYDGLRLRSDRGIFLSVLLRDLTKKYLSTRVQQSNFELEVDNREAVAGVAAIVAGLVETNSTYEDFLVGFLTADGVIESFDTKRAMLAVLATKEDKLRIILEKSLKLFGDKYKIQHGSMLQQEVLIQIILLTFGYLYRMNSDAVTEMSHSSLFLNAVSNRLGASLPRARYLGMILGTCVSHLVDAEKSALKFDEEDMETAEAKWYHGLVNLKDEVGSIESLKALTHRSDSKETLSSQRHGPPLSQRSTKATTAKRKMEQISRVISIQEVQDTSESEDEDGLVPYEKPDEDPSDSDDDPTLVNRSKPIAPVYITSLITQLRSDEPDTLQIALRAAPSLIRRKAGFGTEISENIDTLLSTLINLQGKGGELEEDEFHSLHLQSLIACFLALPDKVGHWLSSIYFEGDFSNSQRAVILTVIGLGARELAGFEDGQLSMQSPPQNQVESPFPSKRLPPNLAAIYSSTSPSPSPLTTVANQISYSTIQPLALSAADAATGPNILKVRTFSSRLTNPKAHHQPPPNNNNPLPKSLPHTLSTTLYLPLCTRLALLTSSPLPLSTTTPFLSPPSLSLTLQTLTLLLHTLGPSSGAPHLHPCTHETLLLLTAIHTLPPDTSLDPLVLPAILQLLLTLLEVNVAAGGVAEERLVTEFGEGCAELVRWVGGLEGVGVARPGVEEGGEEGRGGMPWTVLAAGIQVKWMEIGRKFQGRMLGLMGGEEGW